MLVVSFLLHRLTAASLSHTNLKDRMLIRPDRANTHITANHAQKPPSSDLYDVIYNGDPSPIPPPRSNICSSFVDRTRL
jgi:hypothetical protein